MIKYFAVSIFLVCSVSAVSAQPVSEKAPNPRTAFLKSLAVPGWGHHYVDKSNWRRGKYHLGAEAVLILSFLGLNMHSNNLQHNWFGYARETGGINVEGRSRSLQLAVGDFNNLEAYNDFQARSRNWDMFIEDIPENRWSWQSDAAREEYNDIRNRFENIDQQLPALIGLMVVNRIVSAVSAYNKARKKNDIPQTAFYFSPYSRQGGVVANLEIGF